MRNGNGLRFYEDDIADLIPGISALHDANGLNDESGTPIGRTLMNPFIVLSFNRKMG
jgi:hypothetical protein